MKIIHLVERNIGGTSAYLGALISYQKNLGFDVFLAIDSLCTNEPKMIASAGDVYEYNFGRKISNLIIAVFRVRRYLLEVNPHVIHLHGSFAGVIGRLAAVGTGVRVVYCAHGWAFNQSMGGIIGSLTRFFYKSMEKLLLGLTDSIVCISRDDFRTAQRKIGRSHKLYLIHHRLADDVGGGNKVIPTKNHKEHVKLIFIGRFDKQKGLDILLSAWAKIRPNKVYLDVVGAFDRDGDKQNNNFDGVNIMFHDWKSKSDVMAMLAGSDAVVIPSRWEGFGLVAIEAMMMSCMLIVSDSGALPEFIIDGYNGFIFSDQAALEKIITDIDQGTISVRKIETMGKNNRNIFVENYLGDAHFAALEEVYKPSR